MTYAAPFADAGVMNLLFAVLFLLALGCFVAAAAGRPSRYNLVALGLAFAVTVPLIEALRAL